MADREWFEVQSVRGRRLAMDDGTTDFPNKESAVAFAREHAMYANEDLMVVKYVRKELKTFQRKVTVDEADVAAAPPA